MEIIVGIFGLLIFCNGYDTVNALCNINKTLKEISEKLDSPAV